MKFIKVHKLTHEFFLCYNVIIITMTKSIELKIVGHDNKINEPTPDGSKSLRLFSKGKGKYRITFNDDDNPCLEKVYTEKPYTLAIIPYINEKYVRYLKEGKTVLIDDDIVAIKN